MIASPEKNYITVDEYLHLEEQSLVKHEYIDGEVFDMAGASDAHVTIAGNLLTLIRNHIRGSGCRVYFSDMKVRLEKLNRLYYPDILVTCDPRDQETPNYKQFPCLIIEILSESTEAFERGDKFVDYQTLDSLKEYVLINTKISRVERFRRTKNRQWLLDFFSPENPLFELNTIGIATRIDTLYEDVNIVD